MMASGNAAMVAAMGTILILSFGSFAVATYLPNVVFSPALLLPLGAGKAPEKTEPAIAA